MIQLIALFLILLIGMGCSPKKGTSTGNPEAQVDMQIQSTKPGALSSSALSSAINIDVTNTAGNSIGTLTLTRGELSLRDIEITTKSEQDRDDDGEVDIEGPFIVDLVNNTVTPSLESLNLPAGNYDEIALKLHKIDGQESGITISPSHPLYGNSIAISGSYSGTVSDGAGGTTTITDAPFSMSFDFNEEFTLGANGGLGFELLASQQNTLIIAFRLNKWLKFSNSETNSDAVDFEEIQPNGSGEIVLDDSASGALAKVRSVIKENIKESADFGKDYNGNGELEKEEDDDPDDEDDDDD